MEKRQQQKQQQLRNEARRQSGTRLKKKKKRKMGIFYGILILFVLSVGVALSLTVFFNVEEIRVENTGRYTQEEILQYVDIQKGQNLFLSKTRQSSERIENNLPYVEKADIKRKFPGTISIAIAEAQVAGYLEYNGAYVILSDKSKVLELRQEPPAELIELKGFEVTEAVSGRGIVFAREDTQEILGELSEALQRSGIRDIGRIEMVGGIQIQLRYQDRITINLGTPTELRDKLDFAKKILADKISDMEKGTLDVSNPKQAPFSPEYASSSSASGK